MTTPTNWHAQSEHRYLLFCLILLASQQSFTLPTEPIHAASENRPSAAQGAPGSGVVGMEHREVRDIARSSTPEEAQQAFLSRLLLMLGSFVVLCLVLF